MKKVTKETYRKNPFSKINKMLKLLVRIRFIKFNFFPVTGGDFVLDLTSYL